MTQIPSPSWEPVALQAMEEAGQLTQETYEELRSENERLRAAAMNVREEFEEVTA